MAQSYPQNSLEEGPPASLHAEKTILGGCLVEPAALADSKELLKPSDFFLDSHQRIFRSILRLEQEGIDVDTITVTEDLQKHHELDSVGGLGYLHDLSIGIPRRLNIQSYARDVLEASRKRDLLKLSEVLGNAARANEEASEVLVARAKGWLGEIEDDSNHTVMESVGSYILREQPDPHSMFTVNAKSLGLLTPWMQVNTLTCGFQPKELIIIAGRPSMGKSALALNLADYVTMQSRKRFAIFSTEMSMESMLMRLYCARARVDTQKLKNGTLTSGDKAEILHVRDQFLTAPLFMSDKRRQTASQIRSAAVRLHRDEELDGILIDQLSGVSRADCKERDKHQKIGEQTRIFKELSQELGLPVIVLNQLTRSSTDRKDSRPMLSDLKESGSLEEDADVVAFVHRREYYDRNDPELTGKGEIIIAKQRNGPVGTATVDYNEAFCLWKDSDQEQIGY